MTITRSDVADLRPGDVVEMSWPSQNDPDVTVTMRGTLRDPSGVGSLCLGCAGIYVRRVNGEPVYGGELTLTVVSRVPRPLYVNHDRAEPVTGDVVRRGGENDPDPNTWYFAFDGRWFGTFTSAPVRTSMPLPLRLLVDGETGMPPAVTQ